MKPTALLMTALIATVAIAGCLNNDDDDTGATGGPAATQDYAAGGFVADAFDNVGLPVPGLVCHPANEITAFAQEAEGAAAWTEFAPLADVFACNFEMTPDEGREGNELTIAVNPLDPQNIVGGAKDYYPADAGECVWDGVYVTHDGGRTPYEDRSFDGSPWRIEMAGGEGFEPNYASTFWCTTDPVAYFNTGGTLYYLLMAYQTDRVTGSKTCEQECPNGALNDWAFNRATQIVAVSDDGGDTFHTFTPIQEGTFPSNFHDKGWIAASHNGVIHVMWLGILAPGNVYFRSTDGGQTFPIEDMEILAPTGQGSGQGSFVDVGTNNQVYALWTSGGAVQLRRSMDYCATFEPQQELFEVNGRSMPTLEGRDRRGGWPQLATDRNPESPYADALYVAWQDTCQADEWSLDCSENTHGEVIDGTGIWVASSFDMGATWNAPVRVSDAPALGANDQWKIFPAISVSPGGVLDVSWMDSRDTRWIDCPENPSVGEAHCEGQHQTLTQYYSYSLDGGQTWSEDFHVRDVEDNGWDTSKCHHQNGQIFIGDYNDIDSSWQAAHPIWPDTRAGVCDVYTATIARPMFADGWDEERQLEWIDWILEHPL